MDKQTKRAWLAFVQAEQQYREKAAALAGPDLVPMLREALEYLPWQRPALAILGGSSVELNKELLPELFRLAQVSHSLIGEVRRCILRIPPDVLEVGLEPLVRRLISDPTSDDEAYRRIAELLAEAEIWYLLRLLVRHANDSDDVDIREVADDFAELAAGTDER
ncbi:hypothetical protein WEI85_01410 [Actinomycetes bacterium KLBMP 9797]